MSARESAADQQQRYEGLVPTERFELSLTTP